jgi:hypothetical protein
VKIHPLKDELSHAGRQDETIICISQLFCECAFKKKVNSYSDCPVWMRPFAYVSSPEVLNWFRLNLVQNLNYTYWICYAKLISFRMTFVKQLVFVINGMKSEKGVWDQSRLSVCLPACISTAPTGRNSVKFRIEDFYKNLSRNSKFGYNRTKISDTLHEDFSAFKYFVALQQCKEKPFLVFLGNTQRLYIADSYT